MIILGLQKLTLLDYPDKLAATIFTYGCNFYCSFCHNPELVKSDTNNANSMRMGRIKEDEFFDFLKSRQGLLEGVCITGGEPTLYPDLPEFIAKIKELGFKVKLDTNGTNPGMMAGLINKKIVDYLAMDIKAPLSRYKEIVRREVDLAKIKESIKIIMESGSFASPWGKFDYEFRSTLVPDFHKEGDILEMAKLIQGAKKYYLQNFVSFGKILEPTWVNKRSFTPQEMKGFQAMVAPFVEKCEIRM